MVDRAKLFGGGLRMLLSGGSWAHLMRWAKQSSNRVIETRLSYPEGKASWSLSLEEGSTVVFQATSDSLETVTFQAVAAIGKNY